MSACRPPAAHQSHAAGSTRKDQDPEREISHVRDVAAVKTILLLTCWDLQFRRGADPAPTLPNTALLPVLETATTAGWPLQRPAQEKAVPSLTGREGPNAPTPSREPALLQWVLFYAFLRRARPPAALADHYYTRRKVTLRLPAGCPAAIVGCRIVRWHND